MPPTPVQRRSYRVKKSDNALTLPGRVTFPQGSYVSSPISNLPRLPYQQGAGTPASGLAGAQGATSAMYPQTSSPTFTPTRTPSQGSNYVSSLYGYNPTYTPTSGGSIPQGNDYSNKMARPGWLGVTQSTLPGYGGGAQNITPAGTGTGAPVPPPQTVPAQGAAPFGRNAFGERLDSNGDVWNPATAQTDIYGGRFIAEGSVRWERNRKGRLVKVRYLGGGKKQQIKGNPNDRRANQGQAQAPQQVQSDSVASAFVSFRA